MKQLLHFLTQHWGQSPFTYLCKEYAVGNQPKLKAASSSWGVWASRVVICLQWSTVSCRDSVFLLNTWIPPVIQLCLLPLTPNNTNQCQVIYIFIRPFIYVSKQCTGATVLSSATCGHLFLSPLLHSVLRQSDHHLGELVLSSPVKAVSLFSREKNSERYSNIPWLCAGNVLKVSQCIKKNK